MVRGASGVLAPARPACITSCVFSASCVRLYPSSARLCTPAPSLCLPLTTSERTFDLPTEWAESKLFSLSSNDEEYRSQCPTAPQPEPSSKSSSIYSSTLLDLSSTKSHSTCAQRKPQMLRVKEYLSLIVDRRKQLIVGEESSQSHLKPCDRRRRLNQTEREVLIQRMGVEHFV